MRIPCEEEDGGRHDANFGADRQRHAGAGGDRIELSLIWESAFG